MSASGRPAAHEPPLKVAPSAALGARAIGAPSAEPSAHVPQAPPAGYAAPEAFPPDRVEALAAARAEAYKLEVEELRVTVARAHLKIQKLIDEHASRASAMEAELEARGRGEMLARTRCEAAENELRSLRKENARLREAVKRESSEWQEALSANVMQRCRAALQGVAKHGLTTAVLNWRKQALHTGMARWQCAAQLMEAAQVEAEATLLVTRAGLGLREEAAAAGHLRADQLGGPEGWLRDVQRGYRVHRMGNWADAVLRSDLLWALGEWRLAACASAAETDLRDVAGRLRAAQDGMVRVLDGRSRSEEAVARQTAVARVVVGVASLRGVRREGRERRLSLLMGFRPWVVLLLGERLSAAERVGDRLHASQAEGAQSSRRAEALTREVHVLRNNLAAAQKRVREAGAEAEAAYEAAARAEEGRDKSEQLAKLARVKAEGLEREKYSAAAAARKEKHSTQMLRRGVVALALRSALTRGDELLLASAVARWAVVALQPERGAPWWRLSWS